MPYTRIKNLKLDVEPKVDRPGSKFYKADIDKVLGQRGANSTEIVNAQVNNPKGPQNGVFLKVMIALDKDGFRMEGDENLAAIECPPYDNEEGNDPFER